MSNNEGFDRDLRRAAQGLAVESLPDDLLDSDLAGRPAWPRFALPAIAGLLVVATVIAFSRLSGTPPVGASPEPAMSSTPESAQPSPTATPDSTPPPVDAPPGDFVRGPYSCGDGVAGFILWIPFGWYANSAHDGLPACRFVSTEQFVLRDMDDPPAAPITLRVEAGDYVSAADEVERTERLVGFAAVPALRIVERAENGQRLVYVVALDGSLPWAGNPGRYLLAMTNFGDATFDRDRATLDEMFTRFGLQDPYVHDTAAAAEAQSLFVETQTCTNGELRFVVEYPARWFTNPVTPELPACTWFGPTEFTASNPTERPANLVVWMRVLHSAFGTTEPGFFFQSQNVGGRLAERTERYAGTPPEPDTTFRTYQFLVRFGETTTGPNLIASTDTSADLDYNIAKEVLDRMMASLALID